MKKGVTMPVPSEAGPGVTEGDSGGGMLEG